jgi:hypothetical protein
MAHEGSESNTLKTPKLLLGRYAHDGRVLASFQETTTLLTTTATRDRPVNSAVMVCPHHDSCSVGLLSHGEGDEFCGQVGTADRDDDVLLAVGKVGHG